MYIADVQNC